jgi:glycosyltransferase involved in cell wall biosynthesis
MSISCIIPFYNEGDRLKRTLEVVTLVPEIDEIICVDDGSTDGVHEYIKQLFPMIHVVRQEVNQGKVAAISQGVYHATHSTLFLLDADLEGLDSRELSRTIQRYAHGDIDVLIMGRRSTNWFVRLNRGDILFSGQRIVTKEDIARTISLKPKGYQLEVAMNKVLRQQKRRVGALMSTSFTNTYKYKKWGHIGGWYREIAMAWSLVRFAGIGEYLTQVLTFAKVEIKL